MSDILIGAADLYNYDQVRPWVKSARQSGFTGDIYLIAYRIDQDVYKLAEDGVEFYFAAHTPYGTPIQHAQQGSPTQAHNLRFYHAWELLTRLRQQGDKYEHVIMTDVRDVIFQENPSDFLSSISTFETGRIIAPSEHIEFKNEPWNRDNLVQGYGQTFFDLVAQDWLALNVGTIAGAWDKMIPLFHTIYSMTEGRYYPSDQSSFNVLARTLFMGDMYITTSMDGWAAQLGTTCDPTKEYLWKDCCEPRPVIGADGIVRDIDGIPYTIVHQWDRVPELKNVIPERYK